MAAIAAGQLLYPSRTQKISLSTFLIVLKCASLRELWIVAIFTLYYKNLECVYDISFGIKVL